MSNISSINYNTNITMEEKEKEEKYNKILNKLCKTNVNNFIFVYTAPKVGSTSLVTSLKISLGNLYNIIHIHNEMTIYMLTGILDVTVNEIIKYLSSIGKRVLVIDVYRTPIEKKISIYFEKLAIFHFNTSEENIKKYPIEKIVNRFNKLFPYIETEDYYFEKYELKKRKMFDFEKKYTIQKEQNVYYIKLRLCDSNIWGNILSNILNLDVVIIPDYETEKKQIGELYKKFKEVYKIPSNYLQNIECDTYLNYYYNSQEKTEYINKWKNKSLDTQIEKSYTNEEYEVYMNISQENMQQEEIQKGHYIDNGCFCARCNIKRKEIYLKAKKGEIIVDKIKHT